MIKCMGHDAQGPASDRQISPGPWGFPISRPNPARSNGIYLDVIQGPLCSQLLNRQILQLLWPDAVGHPAPRVILVFPEEILTMSLPSRLTYSSHCLATEPWSLHVDVDYLVQHFSASLRVGQGTATPRTRIYQLYQYARLFHVHNPPWRISTPSVTRLI